MRHPGHFPPISLFAGLLCFALSGLLIAGETEWEPEAENPFPAPLNPESDFDALLESTPFTRPINLASDFTLVGVAKVGEEQIAVLFDYDTEETSLISTQPNQEGWRLVGVEGTPEDLPSMSANISTSVGEVFTVRYDPRQLKPQIGQAQGLAGRFGTNRDRPVREPERDYRQGISGDGFRGRPPAELVAKLSKLSPDMRNRLIQQIGQMRERGVSSEDRQRIFTQMVDRAITVERAR